MTTKLDPRLIPAQHLTDPSPTTGTRRGEVKAVAIFESRRDRTERVRDELTELDRWLLMESLRQRRKARRQQEAIHHELFGVRANR